jgi:hypothetical protein
MTALLDRARAHWAESRSGKVEIAEWGVTVHYNAMTLREHNVFEQDYANDPTLAIAKLVQARSLDDKGKRFFDDDLSTTTGLRDDTDPQILLKLATHMRGQASEKQAAKN